MKTKIGSYDEKWLEQSRAKLLKQFDDEKRTKLLMSRMETQMKSIKQTACISYDKSWRSELYNNVSAKDRVQDKNFVQLKLKVNETYKKDEKIVTNFEHTDDTDLINKAYLDEKLSKIRCRISYIEKDYTGFKVPSNKQSVEEVLIERTVKKAIYVLYDKEFCYLWQCK